MDGGEKQTLSKDCEKIQMVAHMCIWKTEEKRTEFKKYFKNFPECIVVGRSGLRPAVRLA